MNFYPHHIGDYMTATAHLSWLEDCAYRRLLDVYYSREAPIPADIAQACRLIRAAGKDEKKAVETVLREFFQQSDAGWVHGRCESEIKKAAEAAERARLNGKKGGRPPKKKPTDNPEETHPVISGNPEKSKSKAPITNTNTSYSVSKETGDESPKVEMTTSETIFHYGVPLLTGAGIAEKNARSFLGGLVKGHGPDAVIAKLRECFKAKPIAPLEWLAAALPPKDVPKKTEWHETQSGIEAMGVKLGVGLWTQTEQFPAYKARVMAAHQRGMQ